MTGAIDHFERHARAYEDHAEARPEFDERFSLWTEAIDRLAPGGGEGRVAIDLGCGSGHLTAVLAGRGFRTISIDGSEAMIGRTRERLSAQGVDRPDVRHHLLPLPGDVVDELAGTAAVAVMSSVIEYIDDDEEVVRQCAQLLAPGGHLMVSFPNRRSLFWRAHRTLKHTPLFAHSASRHQRRQYDPERVGGMARAAGLELVGVMYYALPLQRYAGRFLTGRRPRLATLFLADLRRPWASS